MTKVQFCLFNHLITSASKVERDKDLERHGGINYQNIFLLGKCLPLFTAQVSKYV